MLRYATTTTRAAAQKKFVSKNSTKRTYAVHADNTTNLIDKFAKDVNEHLPADGKGAVLASAFLVSDNAIVDLIHRTTPKVWEGFKVIGVDTLHLFPETHAVWTAMEQKYGRTIPKYLPEGCETQEDFIKKFGYADGDNAMNHADFDFHSKVEPFNRGLDAQGKEILITGRRMDQAHARVNLDVFEPTKQTFNPLAAWSWQDVLTYVDKYDVPFNKRHNVIFRANEEIDALERHLPNQPWTKVDLGKPYWRATEQERAGEPQAKHVYLWKSFGDVHTSVPVKAHETERDGRFVRLANTECGIHTRAKHERAPHGGILVDLYEKNEEKKQAIVKETSTSIELNERQACDVELLCNGGFSPLTGFMTNKEYSSVVKDMRLPEQQIWAIPITLDTNRTDIKEGQSVLLTYKGKDVAVLKVQDVYAPNKFEEAQEIFRTESPDHPGVYELFNNKGKFYIGGDIVGLEAPQRTDGIQYASPRELRKNLPSDKKVIAFQCRNPIHKAHYQLLLQAQKTIPDSTILVHPTCGPTQPGDIDGFQRHQTYEVLQEELNDNRLMWAYLPYSMMMAGPREAIQHMVLRKNFGATHFIIGRDMAGTKSTRTGDDFYGPFDAQDFAKKYEKELGIEVVPSAEMVYTEEMGYVPKEEAKEKGLKLLKLSGTEFRRRLKGGEDIPEWFAFPNVVDLLRQRFQPEKEQVDIQIKTGSASSEQHVSN